jgi:hypothetical protein
MTTAATFSVSMPRGPSPGTSVAVTLNGLRLFRKGP